jgi:hypothetical protein
VLKEQGGTKDPREPTIAHNHPARQQPQLQAVEDVYRACLPALRKKQDHANDGGIHRRVVGGELAHVGLAVTRSRSRAGAARRLLLVPRQLKTARRARAFRAA